MDINNLILIIQTSVAPCVLISGVGLLLLSMTNRIARPIDRIRLLLSELNTAAEGDKKAIKEQIDILYKRAKLLQNAITFAILSIFFTGMVIFTLFLSGLYTGSNSGVATDFTIFIQVFFGLALASLMVSLAYFLLDISEYLNSIRIEIDRFIK